MNSLKLIRYQYLYYLIWISWQVHASTPCRIVYHVKFGKQGKSEKSFSKSITEETLSITEYIKARKKAKTLDTLWAKEITEKAKAAVFQRIRDNQLTISDKAEVYIHQDALRRISKLLATAKRAKLNSNGQDKQRDIFDNINEEPKAFVDFFISTKKFSSKKYLRVEEGSPLLFPKRKKKTINAKKEQSILFELAIWGLFCLIIMSAFFKKTGGTENFEEEYDLWE